MFHFQTLDVYKCAVAVLPLGYALAALGDGELASQLRRAALSLNLNIAEGTGRFGKDERRFPHLAGAHRLDAHEDDRMKSPPTPTPTPTLTPTPDQPN